MKEIICGIYCISNLINNKKYIGQSIDIYRRWAQEKKLKRLNEHLLRSMQKHGINNFKFEILVVCQPDQLNDLEKYYIELYNTTDPDYGYNKTFGGDSAYHRVYRPMSQSQKDKISKANKGRKPTQQELENLRESKPNREKSKKAVFCYENSKVYDSCKSAAIELNLNVDGVRRCASKKLVSTNGYHFCLATEKDNFEPDLRTINERLSIIQKSIDKSKHVVSDDTRQKLRNCQLGRVKSTEEIEKIRKANLGKKLSEEHKQKIKEHARHTPLSDRHKQKISDANKKRLKEQNLCKRVYCLETKETYDSIAEAAKQNGIKDDILVSRCCNGKQKSTNGLHFVFV